MRPEFKEGRTPPGTASPLHRLREHRPYWLAAMKKMGAVCALTLSILATGYRLEWAEAGPATPAWLPNHPSAMADAAFVTESVNTGVAMGIMRPCSREFLTCCLPLGVACNTVGKRRLIWDGRWVNAFLTKVTFVMETLQTEGRSLFGGCRWGGTFDVSQAFHHVDMDPSAFTYLGFEWAGQCYYFCVLPFGLACSPRIFTRIMRTTVAYLRWHGCRLMVFIDDLPFAQTTKAAALAQAATMFRLLQEFGWLLNPDKCVGLYVALQVFNALGTRIDLHLQRFFMKELTMKRILAKIAELLSKSGTGRAPVPVKEVASVKGLIASTWVSTGSAANMRTRAIGWAIESRPGQDIRRPKASWKGKVTLSDQARAELTWWPQNLLRVNGQDIIPKRATGVFDGVGKCDASDTGCGGWLSISDRPLQGSVLYNNLLRVPVLGLSVRRARRHAQDGLEMVAAFPSHIASGSSTLRELYGVGRYFCTFAILMRSGHFLLGLDNICCVFILGGVVPLSATGGKEQKSPSGGSQHPELQGLAIQILDLCLNHSITFVVYWMPRALNERADLLSRMTAARHDEYWLLPRHFFDLDALWGPHSIDRFATSHNAQPLLAPNVNRYCSAFYEAESECVDAFSTDWANEINWCFPPYRLIGRTILHLLDCRAQGTLVAPYWAHGAFWPLLFPAGAGAGAGPAVIEVRELGTGREVLGFPRDSPQGSLTQRLIVAVRVDGRRH